MGELHATPDAFHAGRINAGGVRRDRRGAGSGQRGHRSGDLDSALRQFQTLPGTQSYLIHVGNGGSQGRIDYHPTRLLFVGSAYRTFVLAQYLLDVEAGLLSDKEQLAIDDSVRMFSTVFFEMAGTTTATSVLEAMITHSDNMATDRATLKVGADRVRALIAKGTIALHPHARHHAPTILLSARRSGRPGPRLAGDRRSRETAGAQTRSCPIFPVGILPDAS